MRCHRMQLLPTGMRLGEDVNQTNPLNCGKPPEGTLSQCYDTSKVLSLSLR